MPNPQTTLRRASALTSIFVPPTSQPAPSDIADQHLQGAVQHILNCNRHPKPHCVERCWYYWFPKVPSPISVNNTTPPAAEIATLKQREARLKAKQERQRRVKEDAEVDKQLLGTTNRKQSGGASNQEGVTMRQSWGLLPYDGSALPSNTEGEAKTKRKMDEVNEIIDTLSEETDSPKSSKIHKTPRGYSNASTRTKAAKHISSYHFHSPPQCIAF